MALVRWLLNIPKDHPLIKGLEIPQRELDELWFLRVFTVDFAVFSVFGNTPVKAAILDAFYDQVEEGIMDPARYTQLLERLTLYGTAMRQSGTRPGGPVGDVGSAFARACGVEGLDYAFYGGMEFGTVAKAIKDLLLGWREKYTIV